MTLVVETALAGYGVAILLGWASARLERWWTPTWSTTVAVFAATRHTPPVAAASAALAASTIGVRPVGIMAAGTAAWLAANMYVLLLVAARK